MAKKIAYTPAQAAELRRLRSELVAALKRAAAAFNDEAPGHALEGEAFARLEAEEKTIAAIKSRVKEIEAGG